MDTKEFKSIACNLRDELKNITENSFFSDFKFSEEIPMIPGQYWEYELSVLEENFEDDISRNVGYFSGSGGLKNPNLSINDFFNNNDRIVKEFFSFEEQGVFDSLVPLLNNYDYFNKNGYSVVLNINSFIIGGDEWLRQVCNEYMLILHIDEQEGKTISIGNQQSERYKIKIEEPNQTNFLIVPFDKCRYFTNYSRVEGYYDMKYYEYEVALSFAGEDRELVYEIAHQLKRSNIRVFYDEYETVTLWGKDLYTHLDEVYRKKSKYCVIFLSRNYKEKVWTNHERESAQARAFTERQEYILPIRLDNTEIPGIRPTTGYISGTAYSPSEIAGLIKSKVRGI